MSNYQVYDFIKDLNFHIKNKLPIDLSNKSQAFKNYLFKLKIFQLNDRIKKDHPIFNESYFIFIMFNVVYVAKRFNTTFTYIEIKNGLKIIRKIKLRKLFK